MKLIGLFLLISTSLYAKDYSFIKDPNNLLKKVDKFIGWTTFDETFKCGTKLTYLMNQCATRCEPYYCEEVCKKPEKAVVTVKDCDKSGASLYSDGKVWIRVQRSRFKDFNWIRGWLGAPVKGQAGKGPNEKIGKNFVTFNKLEKEVFKLANGKELQALRLHVVYSYWNESIKKYNHSHQSMVVGRSHESSGVHLEHRFHESSKPVARLLSIER